MKTEPSGGWFYLSHGVMTHFRRNPNGGATLPTAAECEITPNTGEGWHGTGSPEEVEKSAALPHCRKCALLVWGPL